ncbi:MAG: outer membrane lipid asymmetry maintenance protein MlaD [Gammaproteobacteria bacterium]
MKRLSTEFVVGLFVLAGLVCFSYLAVKMGNLGFLESSYTVQARFTSISGLKQGAFVELAGVRVGKVDNIMLDNGEFEAIVDMAIDNGVQIQQDAIASIRTQGIIGDKFIKISPGGAEETIEPGGEILETESAISLEELVSKYIFQSGPQK